MVLCFISMDVDIGLFSDTKPPENLPEYLICGYLSGYLGDVGDGCTKVFGE